MRFDVISIHYTNKCNMNCPFCYVKPKKEMPNKFWYDLIPYLKKLTPQIALGGGEPFTNITFIKEFSKRARQQGLITNATTNGRILAEMEDKQLKDVLKDITMVSISYDNFKIKTRRDKVRYMNLVMRIKRLTKCQVGCNLLIDKEMNIAGITNVMFNLVGVHRVFALFPKNMPKVDILKKKREYYMLSAMFEHFYVDDCTRQIMSNNSYTDWKTPCHFFKNMVSISQDGTVSGCSFDCKGLMKINKPEDIMKILEVKADERFSCPYIVP